MPRIVNILDAPGMAECLMWLDSPAVAAGPERRVLPRLISRQYV